jgi:aryl-alcohol dehydrogenase-like predicted oxidoreductase
VDFVFAHRPDPETPVEENSLGFQPGHPAGQSLLLGHLRVVRGCDLLANQIARENHLRPPSMEQPQYNLLHRERFEKEYAILYKELGYGTTSGAAGFRLADRQIQPGLRA